MPCDSLDPDCVELNLNELKAKELRLIYDPVLTMVRVKELIEAICYNNLVRVN